MYLQLKIIKLLEILSESFVYDEHFQGIFLLKYNHTFIFQL